MAVAGLFTVKNIVDEPEADTSIVCVLTATLVIAMLIRVIVEVTDF